MSERNVHVLLASAGSGKTWRLSLHYLRLLVDGVAPERILASTFTRKAAGEILGRVLGRLADAAADDAASAKLVADLGSGPRTRAQFADLLARLVRNVQRFRIRTLDAFFAELARGFAAELELPPDWTIADEIALRRERSRAIAAALERGTASDWLAWLAQVERAHASRRVHDALMSVVGDALELAQDSAAEAWGRLDELPALGDDDLQVATRDLERLPLAKKKDGGDYERWINARAQLLDDLVARNWKRIATQGFGEAVLAGKARFDRGELSPEFSAAVAVLLRHVAAEVARDITLRARSVRNALDAFEVEYARRRALGDAVAFDDLPRALLRGNTLAPERGDELALRLDARLDHVLLDEFQDTSPAQWRVLAPLVTELAADGTGVRSVFVVGDVKQSIYGWRAAEPRLLELLPGEFNVAPTLLDKSFRSAQVVLDAVNRLFTGLGASPVFAGDPDAQRVAEQFAASFAPHTTHRPAYAGEVRVHTCAVALNVEDAYEDALQRAVEIVLEIRTAAPAATIAILFRRKKLIPRLVYLLRSRGVFASGESGNQLGDSLAVQTLLSLLTWIDHPDDTAACFHVATSALGAGLGVAHGLDDGTRRRKARELHARIASIGLARFLESLRGDVASAFEAWDVRRFGQLVDAAHAWPEAASLRLVDFVERARSQAVDDSSAALVKVMTVHASKGLEFDAVVLPELEREFLVSPDAFRWRRRDGDPRAEIHAVVRALDKHQRALLAFAGEREFVELERAMVERDLRDELSNLYVAITRAAHRVDFVLRPEASKTPRFSAAGLVRHAFGLGDGDLEPRAVVAEQAGGSASWTRDRCAGEEPASRGALEPAPLAFGLTARPRELERARPSQLGAGSELATESLFERESSAALARGNRWHAWLERVEWLDSFRDDDAELLAHARRLGFGGDALELDLAAFRAALESPVLRRLLARREHAEVWRERRFAQIFGAGTAGARLVGGAFDRVVIERPPGRPARAELIDFKTGVVAPDELAARSERYRPQIELYRRALARITGLTPESIVATLVFVECELVVEH